MSRSVRRTPIIGMCCAESDKDYKVAEHRKERRSVRVILGQDALRRQDALPSPRAFGSPYNSNKDGKQYVGHLVDVGRWLRK